MINQTIKNYKITEKIGEGGMGVVYKAYDSKLDRTVALKFLPDAFSASELSKKRFLREARAASALDHHNTCTIHEIDETADGKLFIVMPAYEGQTLDKLIEGNDLQTDQIIDIAIQIAEGLKAAHNLKIVHRDIKSSNILVDGDGHTVIMDFGLAIKDEFSRLTGDGETLGTVNYMSPEQVLGGEVDHRTDIWSLGVILYEMLSGESPFQCEYSQATIYCILHEEPKDLAEHNPSLSPELVRVVKKALMKNRDERYQQVGDMLDDLHEIKGSLTVHKSSHGSGTKKIFSGVYQTKKLSVSIVLVAITFIVGFYFYSQSQSVDFTEREWVMITDFENETDEEVFNQFLGQVLEISIQQSAYMNLYDNENIKLILQNDLKKEDIRYLTPDVVQEAASFKNVDLMLEPHIKKQEGTYFLSVLIRDLSSKNEITLGPYDATDQKDVLTAIDEMARDIRLKLGEPPSQISRTFTPVSRATTSSIEALKLYVDGVRLKATDIETGIELIEQSVQIDPDFAMAQAELGMQYYIYNQPQKGEAHFQKALQQLNRLTTRERLWIQAVTEDWRGNRTEAIQKYRAYLNQYPDDYYARWRIGYTYLITGNTSGCIESYTKVLEIEPRQASALVNLATCYSGNNEFDLALKYYEQAFEIQPNFKLDTYVNNEYGFLLARIGRLNDARSTFELMLEYDTSKARGLRNLALLAMYEGKLTEASDHLIEAIRLNKSKGIPLSEFRDRMYLARIYLLKDMIEKYNTELAGIEELMSDNYFGPSWLSKMGIIYVKSGHLSKADSLLKIIESRVDDPLAISGIRDMGDDEGFYYVLKGKIETAREEYLKAIESLEIATAISVYNREPLAECYIAAGNIQKAIEVYLNITEKKDLGKEYQQDWILAHYHLGKLYEQQGDAEEAIKYYRTFADIWKDGDEDIAELKDARDKIRSTEI